MLHRHVLMLGLSIPLLIWPVFQVGAQSDDATACQSSSGAQKREACSRIIDSGELNGKPISESKLAIVLVYRSRAYSAEQRHSDAIADLSRAIRLSPKYAAAYYYRGLEYEKQGRADRSLSDFDAAFRHDPKLTAALTKRGLAYLETGRFDRAIADLTDSLKRRPKDARAHNGLGRAYAERMDFGAAQTEFDKAVNLNPQFGTAYANRGAVRLALGDELRAVADFDKALEIDPESADALCGRARVWFHQEEFNRSLIDFEASVRSRSVANPCLIDRGRAYLQTGQYDLAIEDFEEVARFEKSGARFVEASALLINAYQAAGQAPRAEALLARAEDEAPEVAAAALHERAKAKARAGQLDPALSDWRRAAELRPKIAEYRLNIGTMIYRAGKRNRGRKEWQAACSMATRTEALRWQYALSATDHYTGAIKDGCDVELVKAIESCTRAGCRF